MPNETYREAYAEAQSALDGVLECVREVSWAFEQLEQADTLPRQASAYARLNNAVADLETWHPNFDIETGDIREDIH